MFIWGVLTVVTVISNALVSGSLSSEKEVRQTLENFVTVRNLETDGVNDVLEFIGKNDIPNNTPWDLFKKVTNQVFQCVKVETLRHRATKAFENLVGVSSRKGDIFYGRNQDSMP
ncbi:hypothetical protein ROZALSC1DRAFT_28693, partial [Rozella allomycis CSF55]